MSIMFSEADKYFNKDQLSDKAKQVLESAKQAADPNFDPGKELKEILHEDRAKYKIEIIFPPNRTANGITACAVTTFKSGGQIHGGGDEMLYLCRSEKDAHVGCGSVLKGPPLVATFQDGGMMTVFKCPKCKKHVNRELCSSTLLYKLPLRKIAENVYKLFRDLDSNADIYMKYTRTDIRAASLAGTKGMEKVKPGMEYSIYTVKNIFKDCSNDSQVLKKIEDFLSV